MTTELRLPSLPKRWREKAETIRPFAPAAAKAFDEVAIELEAALQREGEEIITPRQAARESGYTVAHIRRLIADGQIPNVGTADGPAVRRRDLPRKPGHGIVADPAPRTTLSRSQAVRAVVNGG